MYRKILVAVDGGATGERALREAIRLAKAYQAKLFLVHVVEEYGGFMSLEAGFIAGDLVRTMVREGRRILREAQALAARSGVRAQAVVVEAAAGGSAAAGVLQQAKKLGVDLIVIGTHGRRGARRLVLGSDAEQVVREARVPVLVVRGAARARS